MNATVESKGQRRLAWGALTYFNLYRFLVALLFVSLYWIGQLPEPLGEYDRALFAVSAHLYLGIAVLAQLLVRLKTPAYVLQVISNVLLDILIINLMMYASAGLNSGFGMLLVISIAAGSILSSGKISILYAAVASLAVLGCEVYMQWTQEFPKPNYTHAGFLGMTFFFAAFLSHRLASKVEVTEALAEQRGLDLRSLSQLNEHIVQRLQSGVIVLNEALELKLLNESAKRLLDLAADATGKKIGAYSPAISEHLQGWLDTGDNTPLTLNMGAANTEVMLSFSRLGSSKVFNILIFLEEVSPLRQRAQQMKLASLGRLTAGIAHEIRNPLGAISHAGQLLSESDALGDDDRKLTHIIEEHSRRVNNIIENIMRISRREAAAPAEIELTHWLKKFADEFSASRDLDDDAIRVTGQAAAIMVRMDPDQLHQILWNLCENAMRYSKDPPRLEANCAVKDEANRPYLDVIDRGPGIPAEIETHLFEPFFTTHPRGTGLGLYLAKELCEANQASLNLQKNSAQGCVFRIRFSHPERQHILN